MLVSGHDSKAQQYDFLLIFFRKKTPIRVKLTFRGYWAIFQIDFCRSVIIAKIEVCNPARTLLLYNRSVVWTKSYQSYQKNYKQNSARNNFKFAFKWYYFHVFTMPAAEVIHILDLIFIGSLLPLVGT